MDESSSYRSLRPELLWIKALSSFASRAGRNETWMVSIYFQCASFALTFLRAAVERSRGPRDVSFMPLYPEDGLAELQQAEQKS